MFNQAIKVHIIVNYKEHLLKKSKSQKFILLSVSESYDIGEDIGI